MGMILTNIIHIYARNRFEGTTERLYLLLSTDVTNNSSECVQVEGKGRSALVAIAQDTGINLFDLTYRPKVMDLRVTAKEFKRILKGGPW